MPAIAAEQPPAKSVLPWLMPVLGLLLIVAALWLRAAADRRPVAAPASPAPVDADRTEGDGEAAAGG
jgi:protein-S-isoprenylcysteine O-methyltransferase Ste14